MISRTGLLNITTRGSSTSYTISHDAGFGNVTLVFLRRTSATGPTSITYGGDSMTKLENTLNSNSHTHEIWGILEGKTGVNDIVVTTSDSQTLILGAASYRLVSPTNTFPDTHNSGQLNGTPLSVSVTTTKDDCVLLGIGGHEGLAADQHSAGTNTSRISLYNDGSGVDVGILESSPFVIGTAGTYSLEITLGAGGQDMVLCVVALSPNPKVPGASSVMIL